MAENVAINVTANTTQAVTALKNVETKLKDVTDKFSGLKTLLGSLAIGNAISSVNNFALAVDQVNKSTGVSIQTISNFSDAVGAAGGNASKAVGDVQDFVIGLYEAKKGSSDAQLELQKVGITLEDLGKLSNEDLFKKTVKGLADIGDASERNALALKLLGKNFKDIDIRSVSAAMSGVGGGANASAIQAAAAAQQNLVHQIDVLRNALLNVLEPLNKTFSQIHLSVSAVESLIKAALALSIAFFAIPKALAIVNGAIGLFAAAVTGSAVATIRASAIFANWSAVIAATSLSVNYLTASMQALFAGSILRSLGYITTAFGFLGAAIAGILKIILRFAGWVGIIYAVAEAVNFLSKQFYNFDIIDAITSKISNLYNKAKEFFGLSAEKPNAGAGRGGNADTLRQQQEQGAKMMAEYEAARAEKLKVINKLANDYKLQLTSQVNDYIHQNDLLREQLDFETNLIGKSEDFANKETKLFEIRKDGAEKLFALEKQLADLRLAASLAGKDTPEEQRLLAFQNTYGDAVKRIKAETSGQVKIMSDLIDKNQSAALIEKDRLNNLERITEQLNFQKEAAGVTSGIFSETQQKIKDIQFGAGQRGKSIIEQRIGEINKTVDEFYKESAGKIMAAFETEDGYRNIEEMNRQLALLKTKTDELRQAQIDDLMVSRSFSEGWKVAFNEYVDNVTNAANRAKSIFNSVMNSMESAIDKFVDTGKFSFNDFAESVIKDLIKIELKAAAVNFMKAASGGIGSLFGFADGGNPPIGRASIVGENGPELIVPRTASTVVPMNGGGQQVTNNYYTVNAVDAKSVAQLFAENRKTLLGSVKMAEKEMPYRMR